jgi:hypothetical protein
MPPPSQVHSAGSSRPSARRVQTPKSAPALLGAGVLVVLLWTLLFYLNEWLFSDLSLSKVINWIFLPAAIRMLSVMVLGWVGAVGLFVGALLTNDMMMHAGWADAVVIAGLSALGPVAAVKACGTWLQMSADLSGLRPSQLMIFSLAGAVFNVVPHNIYFFFSGHTPDIFSGMIPMLVGDLLGTLVILYFASLALKLFTARS